MSIIEKFNALNGVSISKNEIETILFQAKKENEAAIVYRLSKLLNDYPDAEDFIIELEKFDNNMMNAPRHKGDYKEALDECGRLKKGWKYENGNVIKVIKKEIAKKNLVSKSKKIKKNIKIFKNIELISKVHKNRNVRTFEKQTFKPEDWIQADVRKSTSLIKKYLLEKYNIKASVRSEFYSGGSSLNIRYNFGPDDKVITRELKRLQYGTFDGMTDSYNMSDEAFNGIILDGNKIYEYKYVFVDQDLSESFKIKLATAISDEANFTEIHKMDGTKEAFYKDFKTTLFSHRNWSEMFRYLTSGNHNFSIQNENEIENIRALKDVENSMKYYFQYTVKGKEYDSRKPTIYPTKMVKEKNIVKNKVVFFELDNNIVAVIGYLGEIEDKLLDLGGIKTEKIKYKEKFNDGFIFNKSKSNKVIDVLIDYSKDNALNSPISQTDIENYPVQTIIITPPQQNIIPISNIPTVPTSIPITHQEPQFIRTENKTETVFQQSNEQPKEEVTIINTIEPKSIVKSKNPLVKSMAERKEQKNEVGNEIRYFDLSGQLAEFYGQIEIKPKESVAITFDADQGAGKTRLLFQTLDMFASGNYRCLFLSLEEHPDSELIISKQEDYIKPQNQHKIDTIGELPKTYKELVTLMDEYDATFIDSWGKLLRAFPTLDFDFDLRKKLDGKLFGVIFQRTQDGKMRGGSNAQFDGDIITKIEKDASDYKNSYAYFDKNRYNSTPAELLKYNIFNRQLMNVETETI